MNRLSLEALKAKKSVVQKLEAIKGGNTADCHIPPTRGGDNGGGSEIEPIKKS